MLKRPLYRKCYQNGRKYHTKHFIVFVRCNQRRHWRLGVTASKKIGPAVLRNRIKRLVREAFRLSQEEITLQADIVVVCKKRPDLWDLDLDTVKGQILKLLNKIQESHKEQSRE